MAHLLHRSLLDHNAGTRVLFVCKLLFCILSSLFGMFVVAVMMAILVAAAHEVSGKKF